MIRLADQLLRDPTALIIVKATLVLVLASAVSSAVREWSAARRHLLWRVALCSCLWLALSSPVVPGIPVRTTLLAPTGIDVSTPMTAGASSTAPGVVVTSAHQTAKKSSGVLPISPTNASIPSSSHPLLFVWMVGCASLLLRQLQGFVAGLRLVRRAVMATDDDVAREPGHARRRIGIGYSASVRTPITFGVVNPVVLLPAEACAWPRARRRTVLAHELAHVERGDWLTQMIGQLACALFWFHPLAWFAFGRLRAEAERAADDCVLRAGVPPLEYATHLLELARRAVDARSEPAAVGIVSRNDLESRFRAIFENRSRIGITRRGRSLATGVALAVVSPLASLRIVAGELPAVPLRRAAAVTTQPPANAIPIVHETRDTATVRPAGEMTTPIAERPVRDSAEPSNAVVERGAETSRVRPDFSGVWRVESGGPTDGFINDSVMIKQSADSLSLESRGRGQGVLTRNSVHNVTFDGAWSRGMAVTGDRGISFTTRAAWEGDTLVLTNYAVGNSATGGLHDLLNIERMTLSPDGSTLIDATVTIPDGRIPLDGAQVFVLRRMTR